MIARRALLGSSVLVLAMFGGATYAAERDSGMPNLAWQKGPCKGKLGTQAEITVPQGFSFTGAKGTQQLLQLMQNPISGDELGLLQPDAEDESWFIVFEFDEIGYVKDDDKKDLDADAILESIKEGTEASNEERRKHGWAELHVVGWEQKPHYDESTHNLEWATRAQSEGEFSINHNTRLLGRRGVMEATLVADPKEMPKALPRAKQLLAGFTYTDGNRYAEFRAGDKIAKYGLTALITGGAAAVALKTGLLQKFWKLIVIGVVGIGAAIKKIFGRRTQEA